MHDTNPGCVEMQRAAVRGRYLLMDCYVLPRLMVPVP